MSQPNEEGISPASQLAMPFLMDWELGGAEDRLTVERLGGDDKSEWTVGAGHLVTPEDNLKLGDMITKERQRDLFVADVRKAEVQAAKDAGEAWDSYNDNERAAVISATFNIGSHDKGWNATRHLRDGNIEDYLNEMYNPETRRGVVHNTIDGVKYRLLGLERRRLAERLLAQGQDYQSAREYLLGELDKVQVDSPTRRQALLDAIKEHEDALI
jgi:GH24 family phage-related lysozyme (muramidase)